MIAAVLPSEVREGFGPPMAADLFTSGAAAAAAAASSALLASSYEWRGAQMRK